MKMNWKRVSLVLLNIYDIYGISGSTRLEGDPPEGSESKVVSSQEGVTYKRANDNVLNWPIIAYIMTFITISHFDLIIYC